MRRLAALTVALLLALAACGDDGDNVSTPEVPPPNPPTGADELVIQVSTGGGLIAPQSLAVEIPYISVYGDGTFIVPGPTTLEYPGPALPNLQQGRISEDELQRLLVIAHNIGLLADEPPDFGDPGVTDWPSTEIVVNDGRGEHRTSIYALDFVEGDDDLDDDERAAREAVRDFVDALPTDEPTETYSAQGFAVLVSERFTDEIPEGGRVDWPLGSLLGAGEPIEGFGTNTRCLVVAGTDGPDTLRGVARDARDGAVWYSEGLGYTLTFRPLLPHELATGCDNLRHTFVGA